MRRFVALFFTSLGGVALAARYRWARLAEIMAIAFAIMCVGSFLVGLGVPSIGRMSDLFPGSWRGLWAEKNALGDNMALFAPAFVAAALLNRRRAKLWWAFFGLAVLLLLLSTSKTSLIALMLGFAAACFIAVVRRGGAIAVAAIYAAVVGVALAAAVILFARNELFALLGKDATLTGRTEIWAAILTEVKKHPWLGHGYGTVWTEEGRWGPLAWIVKHAGFRPHHAHSSWMEQLLWLGISGFVAWICFYAQTMVAAMAAMFRTKGAYLALPFLLTYTVISITESITLTYNDLRWVIFVAIACKLAWSDPPAARN
jgi:O-antigen ligase